MSENHSGQAIKCQQQSQVPVKSQVYRVTLKLWNTDSWDVSSNNIKIEYSLFKIWVGR